MKRGLSRVAVLLGGLGLLSGCPSSAPRTAAGGVPAPLTVRSVDWNVNKVALSKVEGVADDGSVVAVLTDRGASIFSAGAFVASDGSKSGWVGAGVIPGADGAPRWIVGIDGGGHVDYLRNLSAFEDVSSRYGLDAKKVRAVASLGGASVAFLLDHEVAIADGRKVARYPVGDATSLAGAGGVVVAFGPSGLQILKPAAHLASAVPLAGVRFAAVGPEGLVYAATSDALYASDAAGGDGGFSLVLRASSSGIHGLVASNKTVWFADGRELGTLDGTRVSESSDAHLGPDARLVASTTGDVWVLDGPGLYRYQVATASPSEQAAWGTSVAPVFARACSACHLPGGRSGLDLSTAAAWGVNRALIDERVLATRTMPPRGHPISDADRAAIQAWVKASAAPR